MYKKGPNQKIPKTGVITAEPPHYAQICEYPPQDSVLLVCQLVHFTTLREESSQTNVILQYKLLAPILSAVCSVIQQSYYVLHFYYTLYDGKYDGKIIMH